MTEKTPILDLQPEIEARMPEYLQAVEKVLRSGQFILGPQVKAFEAEVAQYLGVKHVVGLNSGTDALIIGLRALNVGPGDEVIVPSFTFFATAEAVSLLGATPIFVDIDPATLTIDPAKLAAAVTTKTKAIIPVHLFGLSADLAPILELAKAKGLFVLEDVAQAFGSDYRGKKLGTLGDIGAFSFFPSKNLGAFGDGGALTTNDDKLAEMARKLRAHGSLKKYHNEILGYNSRLDEIQAAFLRIKLRHIETANEGRRNAAKRYSEIFSHWDTVTPPTQVDYSRHVFHQYTIRVRNGKRTAAYEALDKAGIQTMIYYPVPVHRLPVYQRAAGTLPETEHAAEEVLSLPIWPEIQTQTQLRIVDVLKTAVGQTLGQKESGT